MCVGGGVGWFSFGGGGGGPSFGPFFLCPLFPIFPLFLGGGDPSFGPFCFGGLFLLLSPFLEPFFFWGGGLFWGLFFALFVFFWALAVLGGGFFFVLFFWPFPFLGPFFGAHFWGNQEALHDHWLVTTAETVSDQDKCGEAQLSHRLQPKKALRQDTREGPETRHIITHPITQINSQGIFLCNECPVRLEN